MHALKLKDAEPQLAELIDKVARGDDVVITVGDGAAFKIVPVQMEEPRPTFGSAKGLIEMADDFDAPLDDFEPYGP